VELQLPDGRIQLELEEIQEKEQETQQISTTGFP
jgi:hypothetical protein